MKTAIILGSAPSGQAYKRKLFHTVLGSNDAYFRYDKGTIDKIFVGDDLQRISKERPRTLETPAIIPVIGYGNARDIKRVDKFYQTTGAKSFQAENLLKQHGSVTPHFCCLWALAHGFKRLEVWGVDLTNFGKGEGAHVKTCMKQFAEIYKLAKSMGAEMVWSEESAMYSEWLKLTEKL